MRTRGGASVRFGILGPLAVWRDGDEIEVGGPRVRALLALLLIEAGRAVPATRLIDGLWGDRPPRGVANALQSQISRLRSTLSPDVELASRPEGYVLAVDPEVVDAGLFERLAAEGRRALAGGDAPRAAGVLARALDHWRGDPLAGLAGSPALDAEATRLLQLRLAAAEDRLEAELLCGRSAGATPELESLLASHPLDERARGLLMRALGAMGRRADALLVFEEGRQKLAAELGADPSPELQRLHVAILRGEGSAEREARRGKRGEGRAEPPGRAATNLRTTLTSFVGREEGLGRIRELLERHRLVTLTGAGGAGKTRLAVELGTTLLEHLPDGVWIVELAPLSDPAAIPQAALAALQLRETAVVGTDARATEPVARLLEALADKRLLLIVDNCEHLVEAAAQMVDTILARCPNVRVLATSREPLGVHGEDLWQVLEMFEETGRVAPQGSRFPPFGPVARVGLGVVAELEGDADRAERLHRGVLEELRAAPDTLLMSFLSAAAFDGLAGVAILRDQPERAARLLGAAARLRRFELHGEERVDTDRIAGAARRALGDAGFERAHERGRALSREEVLGLASA